MMSLLLFLYDLFVPVCHHRLAMNYRCQSAHKLVELNEAFHFIPSHAFRRAATAPLPWCHTVLDLAAAPGGFSQVAVELMQAQHSDGAPAPGLAPTVLAFDQRTIAPLPHVESFRGSILNHPFVTRSVQPILERRQRALRRPPTSRADPATAALTLSGVLHDSVSVVKGQRAFSVTYAQSQMVLSTLLLSGSLFLKWNTSYTPVAGDAAAAMPVFYVTKAMRSAHLKQLKEVLRFFFRQVQQHKPQSSREDSKEVYLVCSAFEWRRFSHYKTSREMHSKGGRHQARPRNLFSLAPTADDVSRSMQDSFVWHCLGCGQQRVGCSPCRVCFPC
ncbi:tRNA (cytidine32/guanosine34-2'-O)-methyltransferase [Strigomonas culicis]|uniref:tRNA (Cytidine32/guanosine34-2'-O)-methyltransferase n=2 Tax=Strigomonas culicis TaxID=28005 RepID=S9ULL1_9TRYP|nr:tRNA (cytidine32/guanosine34-2'-O)-methyltransferase [Strigomonas culicis]|eukprot:EPY29604.1 tRNA (cytidine32/guanosine34-2'-O)-methyltransferase [Strigomonas culicis]